MIDIPAADIKRKITEAKGLTEEQIDAKIKEKLTQLAGLISEDGAAHIIANELGVEIVKTQGPATIADMFPGMKNVTATGKLTRKYELRTFDKNGRQGKVASFMLADSTGQIRVTLWNDQTDTFDSLNEGDTLRIRNAWVKENRGYKELHLNTDSKLEQNPAGVAVGDIKTRGYDGPVKERKQVKELAGDEQNVELLGTIVQLYDPRFFDVDPDTGKRVTDGHEGAKQTNYVMNAILDDGTGNIRTTFWKQQAQRLLKKTDEEMLQYQDNPSAFEQVKTDMLGEIVKIVGRCKKNDTFDRVEFTANLVFTDVDPEEELKRLNEESATKVEASEAVPAEKAAMKATLQEPQHAKRTEVEAETDVIEADADDDASVGIEEGVTRTLDEEDVISLDDLEDLDEKL